MPNFLIIGANKAGTTALAHYLGEHPEIYISPTKEPMFFVYCGQEIRRTNPGQRTLLGNAVNSLEDYQALFAPANGEIALGEASTAYLPNPNAPENIRRFIPQAKLIAILRHPAERAFSNYLMYRKLDLENLRSFRRAVDAEPERAARDFREGGYPYVQLGLYYEGLKRYFDRFHREQIRVYLYEDWVKSADTTLDDIFGFLGVDRSFRPDMSTRHNVSYVPWIRVLDRFLNRPNALRDVVQRIVPASVWGGLVWRANRWNRVRPQLSAEDRAHLIGMCREDILRLQDLIGRDLTGWLS